MKVSLCIYIISIVFYLFTGDCRGFAIPFLMISSLVSLSLSIDPFCIWTIPFEIICYHYLYTIRWINGNPSQDAYKLNYYHNYNFNDDEIYFKCHHCIYDQRDDELISNNNNLLIYGYDSATILKCGHAFHPQCIRNCEQSQFIKHQDDKWEWDSYRCPVNGCNRMYNWRGGKWNYKYTDSKVFDQIRDETLLKYLPKDIENIIIHFINSK